MFYNAKKPAHQEMNWGFLLFRGSYTYKKGLIVQSSSKTTQLLDPLFSRHIIRFFMDLCP